MDDCVFGGLAGGRAGGGDCASLVAAGGAAAPLAVVLEPPVRPKPPVPVVVRQEVRSDARVTAPAVERAVIDRSPGRLAAALTHAGDAPPALMSGLEMGGTLPVGVAAIGVGPRVAVGGGGAGAGGGGAPVRISAGVSQGLLLRAIQLAHCKRPSNPS